MIPFYQVNKSTDNQKALQSKGIGLISSLLTFLILFLCSCIESSAQVSIASPTAVTENFNSMGTGTALPSGWKMSNSLQVSSTGNNVGNLIPMTTATTAITAGMAVTGTGVPANTKVASVIAGTSITISAPTTPGNGTILSGTPLTFTSGNTVSFATTAATTASTLVTVASTSTLYIGMTVVVASTGVSLGTIASIPSATTFNLSASTTIVSGTTLTFTSVSWSNTGNVTSVVFATTAGGGGTLTGRSYNYRDSTTASDRAVGIQGSTSYLSPQSLMVNYRNTNTSTMTGLSITYKAERYRKNTTAASVDFYWSTDGTNWKAGTTGNVSAAELPTHTNSQYTFNTTNASGLQLKVTKTETITGLSIPQNGDIFIRWNINVSNANSQGIAIDSVVATATIPCSSPSNSPTALTFPSAGTGQISGSFTAAVTGTTPPSGYLVVRYPAGTGAITAPTDAVSYTAGNALGLGTVVSSSAATTFVATGLAISTNYDFYIYSFNNASCTGGPLYKGSPLTRTKSTNGCPTFAATIQIDAAATRTDGSVYNTLTDALNDMSGCAITQPTIIQLNSNYVSTSESFPITLGAITGMSATNTITIRPASGATNLSISGASSAASIISINSGTYWRLDGRAGGTGTTQNLTVENTSTPALSTAVLFINGAQNNIIRYCKLRSANLGVASGSVYFNTSSTVGNSNNTIDNCDIFNSTAGIPNVGIGSVGTNSIPNDNNTISNNKIYDFFNTAGNSYGIYISDNNTNWTISGNSIYETVSRQLTSTTNKDWAGIYMTTPNNAGSVTGFNITGNYIGGSAANCGGGAMTISDNGVGDLTFRGIYGSVGTSSATNIQGNTIQNIAMTSSSASSNHSLISAVTGAFNIGNVTPNILGSGTGSGSVTLTQTTSSTAGRLSGIIAGVGTPGTMVISNNVIGGLSVSNSSTGAVDLAGIYATGAASSYTISGNTIGSTSTANSLQNNTVNDTWGIYTSSSTTNNTISGNTVANATGSGRVLGIRTDGGTNSISANTIQNLSSSSSTSATSAIGIWMNSTTAGQTASGNIVHTIRNTHASSANATAHGIYYTGPTTGTNVIEKNFVHSLSLSSSSTSGLIYGIRILTGNFPVTIQNNMVRVGIDAAGSSINTGYGVFGIGNASSGTTNHFFNTVYVGGSAVSGTTSNTYALLASGTGTRTYQNNILFNARNGGTTGNHYAIQIATGAGLTINNNLYFASGTNGFLYGTGNLDDLVSIRTATGQDAASVSCDPKLKVPTGTSATVDLHVQASPVVTQVEGNGVAISGLTDDFDGQTRSGLTPNDIGADAGNFTAFASTNLSSNSPVCQGTSLNLSLTPNASLTGPNTYLWTGNGTISATQNPSVSVGLVVGTSNYDVIITDATGCISTATTSVTVNQTPSMTSGTATSICSGSALSFGLTASSGATFNWAAADNSGTTGESLTTQSGATINNTITNTSGSNQTVVYTVTPIATTGGSCAGASQTVNVTVNQTPSMTSGTSTSVCSGTALSFGLTASSGATFNWVAAANGSTTGESTSNQSGATINNTITNTSGSNQIVVYTVTPTGNTGGSCVGGSQTVNVTVNQTPSMTSVSSTTICSGTALSFGLTASSGATFNWIAVDNGSTTGESTTNQSGSTINNTITNTSGSNQTVVYTVTPTGNTGGSCAGSDQTVNVIVSPTPSLGSITQTAVCSGNTASINLTGLIPSATFTVAYSINGTAQTPVTGINSNSSGNASFTSPSLTAVNNGQSLAITSLTRTDATPSCSNSFSSGNSVVLAVNPNPTLASTTQTGLSCDGQTSTINLTGLVNNSTFDVSYAINGGATSTVSGVVASGTSASFTIPASIANDGQPIDINDITITSSSPSCSLTPGSNNTLNLYVNPRPSVRIDANDFVCLNQTLGLNFAVTNATAWTMGYATGVSSVSEAAADAIVNGSLTNQGVHSNPYSTTYSPVSKEWKKYRITSLTNTTTGCTAAASGLDSLTVEAPDPCYVTWNGSVSTDWSNGANWTPNNGAPSNKTSVVIPGGTTFQPNLNSGAPVCASLTLTNGAQPLVASGFQLNVRGDISGNTTPFFGGNGKVVLSGTGLQTISGTVRLTNVDFANTSASGVVISPSASLQIEPNGLVTFGSNSKLTNNGKFVLTSNSSGTAKIGPFPTTASLTGNVAIERYLPYTIQGGNWYFLGSSMSGKNFTDFVDDFSVTGLSSGFGQQGGNIYSSIEPERSTIFKYDETTHNTRVDTVQKIGWTIPGNENILPGKGYRVFVKTYGNPSHKVDFEGAVTKGDFTFPSISNTVLGACVPSSFPCNETSNRGWNLLANPYPCDIDWDAAGAAWTKPAQMSNAWYRWNSTGNGYGVYATGIYAGATPAPANPNIISSSQSFFVKVNTAGSYSLSVKELAKSTSTNGTFQRVNTAEEKIRIHLSQNQNPDAYGYDAVIRFDESATDGIDAQSDFANLTGSQFQISIPVENTALSIASFAPVTGTKSIPLHIDFQNANGSFTFRFSDLEVLAENHQIFLKDNQNGTLTPVVNNSEFEFSNSIAGNEDRFELVFSNQSVTGIQSILSGGSVCVYPNPSSKGSALTIAISGMESNAAYISVTDALGRKIISRNATIQAGGTTLIQIQDVLPSGVYMVHTTCGNSTSTQKLIIK
jgi:PKD-like domain/Secretion system C-terminal sorting domain